MGRGRQRKARGKREWRGARHHGTGGPGGAAWGTLRDGLPVTPAWAMAAGDACLGHGCRGAEHHSATVHQAAQGWLAADGTPRWGWGGQGVQAQPLLLGFRVLEPSPKPKTIDPKPQRVTWSMQGVVPQTMTWYLPILLQQ